MPALPAGALRVLEEAGASFSEKPIAAAVTSKLAALDVRRALGTAARAARPHQVPAVLYVPGHGEPLAILAAGDLERLADLLRRTVNNDEGSEK